MTDAELTRLLAEKVMGWKMTTNPAYAKRMVEDRQPVICDMGSETEVYAPGGGFERWYPLERIDHAWMVLGALKRRGAVKLYASLEGNPNANPDWTVWFELQELDSFGARRTGWPFEVRDKDASRAICLTAMRAIVEVAE